MNIKFLVCWVFGGPAIIAFGFSSNLKLPYMYISQFRIFKNFLYQGGVKSTVSWVFEDLKFKISEGYDQNWCFPDSAQLAVSAKLRQLTGQSQENTNMDPNLLKF